MLFCSHEHMSLMLFCAHHDEYMSLFDTCRPGTGPHLSRLSSPSSITRLVARTVLPMFLDAVTRDDADSVGVDWTSATLVNLVVPSVNDAVLESATAPGGLGVQGFSHSVRIRSSIRHLVVHSKK